MADSIQRSDGSYELVVADKVYLVRFSVGIKELIFQKIVEVYAGFLRSTPTGFDPLDVLKKSRFVELYTECTDTKDPERQTQLKAEIDGLVADMFSDVHAREAATAKMQQELTGMLNELHYEVCSVLLTQRDMEGHITEYVSPGRIKFSGEFDKHEKLLMELRAKAFDSVNETVKKTSRISEELAPMLADKLIPSKTLSHLLLGSTQE